MHTKLRQAPSGPEIGNPPILIDDLTSLIAAARGDNTAQDFGAAATYPVIWDSGLDYLAVDLKAGYRYTIEFGLACKQEQLSTSELFVPRWNRRVTSTGLYVATDALAELVQTDACLGGIPWGVTQGYVTHNSACWIVPEFIPAVPYDRIKTILQTFSGLTISGAFLVDANCWVKVWERGGAVP
jgi:hypothetical protein